MRRFLFKNILINLGSHSHGEVDAVYMSLAVCNIINNTYIRKKYANAMSWNYDVAISTVATKRYGKNWDMKNEKVKAALMSRK